MSAGRERWKAATAVIALNVLLLDGTAAIQPTVPDLWLQGRIDGGPLLHVYIDYKELTFLERESVVGVYYSDSPSKIVALEGKQIGERTLKLFEGPADTRHRMERVSGSAHRP